MPGSVSVPHALPCAPSPRLRRRAGAPARIPRATLAPLLLALLLPATVVQAAETATPSPAAAKPAASATPPPCPDAFAPAGRIAAVEPGGDLRLAEGGVLRLAGLSRAGAAEGPGFRAALAELTVGREVELAPAGPPDRYGRRAGVLRIAGAAAPAQRSLQETLLARGLLALRPEAGVRGCLARWRAAEADARRARLGIWRALPLPARDVAAIRARQGLFTIVEGRILSVGNRRTLDYLNFGPVWRQDMTGQVTRAARDALEAAGTPATALAGRRVTLRGTVFEAGGPAIEIVLAEQIGWDEAGGDLAGGDLAGGDLGGAAPGDVPGGPAARQAGDE